MERSESIRLFKSRCTNDASTLYWNIKQNRIISLKSICVRIKFNIIIIFLLNVPSSDIFFYTICIYDEIHILHITETASLITIAWNCMNDRNFNAFCCALLFLIKTVCCGQQYLGKCICIRRCSSIGLTHITLHCTALHYYILHNIFISTTVGRYEIIYFSLELFAEVNYSFLKIKKDQDL